MITSDMDTDIENVLIGYISRNGYLWHNAAGVSRTGVVVTECGEVLGSKGKTVYLYSDEAIRQEPLTYLCEECENRG